MNQKIENKNVLLIGKASDIIAFASAIIGTIILVLYFIPDEGLKMTMLIVGYCYVVIAIVINLLALIILIISIFYYQLYWKYLLTKMGILLLNIPVAILYFLVVMYSLGVVL